MVTTETQAGAATLLRVEGVTVEYGAGERLIKALDDVWLDVREGELVAVVGPNGSGKTTLIRAMTAAVKTTAGRVILGNRDLVEMGQREIARSVAVLPQEPALPAVFTAIECVLMGRTPYLRLLATEGREDVEIARRVMVATGTWRLAERRIGELSGGERQGVVLARALAQETPVLLLDEPTTHLDIGHQAATLALVQRIAREEGKAVLAVVHDLTLAGRCDRVVMLSAGRVVADGPPSETLSEDLVQRVYGLPVRVLADPRTGRPVVAPSFGQA